LRPGRFDRLVYVPICNDKPAQQKVMTALTRKFTLAEGLDLAAIVEGFNERYTGADLYAVAADAWQSAVTRAIDVETEQIAAGLKPSETPSVVVTAADFVAACDNVIPSVSEEEMRYYSKIHKQFSKAAPSEKHDIGQQQEST
jgi:peroxin-6